MKGYKVFNPDWTCRGVKFEVGKTFEEDVKPKCCGQGFHFCTKASDCFDYYKFDPENKVAEVEAIGEVDANDKDTKCCTNKLHIIRELTWQEVLELVNFGKGNTGIRNTGNFNTGNRNAGDFNTGNFNTGNFNTGHYNAGNCNAGNFNTGDYNTGDYNTGNCNTGHYNAGNCNAGNFNTGDWNETYFSNGCFNTEEPKIFIFNKLSDLTYRDWSNSKARYILNRMPSDVLSWIQGDDMTDDEKEEHPEYTVTGGFLKHIERESKRQIWWDELSTDEKDAIFNIPNFDKEIFKKITGINVES